MLQKDCRILTANVINKFRVLVHGLPGSLHGRHESFESKEALDPVLDKAYIDRMVSAYAAGQDLKDPLIVPFPDTIAETVPFWQFMASAVRSYPADLSAPAAPAGF